MAEFVLSVNLRIRRLFILEHCNQMPRMVSGELKKEEDAKGVFKMPPFYCSSKFVQQAVPRKKIEKERGILPFPFSPI